jgi:hypothetical protein
MYYKKMFSEKIIIEKLTTKVVNLGGLAGRPVG